MVCQHTSCLAVGSAQTLAAFGNEPINGYMIVPSECQGQCSTGPTVRVLPEEVWYYRVQPADVPTIIGEHLQGGKPVRAKMNPRIHRWYGAG
jgi:(2Fe-2S) ferredoxin